MKYYEVRGFGFQNGGVENNIYEEYLNTLHSQQTYPVVSYSIFIAHLAGNLMDLSWAITFLLFFSPIRTWRTQSAFFFLIAPLIACSVSCGSYSFLSPSPLPSILKIYLSYFSGYFFVAFEDKLLEGLSYLSFITCH